MKPFEHAVPPTTISVDSRASGNPAARKGANRSTLKARQKLGFDGAGPALTPGRAHCPMSLELLVAEQAKALERLSRLKLFFPPQLVELIISDDAERVLKSRRRDITVVFVDLRGFTAFAETAEPEDVALVMKEYQCEMGRLVLSYEGTLDRLRGDGMMVFFNDPLPAPDAPLRATRMAVDMRDRLQGLCCLWHKLGHMLDFGIGIAQGYATVGAIGCEGRLDYAVIGTVANLASRLCSEARAGQILISHRVASEVEACGDLERLPDLTLKGFGRPVRAYNVVSCTPGIST